MTLARTPLVLFEADERLRQRERGAAIGDAESIARHAHDRLRAGHDPRQVAADTHEASPEAHKHLLDNLRPNDHRRDAIASAPAGRRLARAHIAQNDTHDAYHAAWEHDGPSPKSDRAKKEKLKADSETYMASEAAIPHPEHRHARVTHHVQRQRREGLSRFLHRSHFPEGPEGERHHIRALGRIHDFNVHKVKDGEKPKAGSTTVALPEYGYHEIHSKGLQDALRFHGYNDTHDVKTDQRETGLWGAGEPTTHPHITVSPKKKS